VGELETGSVGESDTGVVGEPDTRVLDVEIAGGDPVLDAPLSLALPSGGEESGGMTGLLVLVFAPLLELPFGSLAASPLRLPI
jgi:hypothetical protein